MRSSLPVSERQRRIDARIARAVCCLMNNTKWWEVFSALRRSPQLRSPIRWHFVGDERIFVAWVPSGSKLLATTLPDDLPYPFGPYREIDWIEVPDTYQQESSQPRVNDLEALAAELQTLGQLPLARTATTLRISGYSW